ncbi:MAG: hypothetical protein ACFFD4_07980 [Candidatus Odinarchaeota archaeon]
MNLSGMSIYPDWRHDKWGRRNGPYYIGSIYRGTFKGKKLYQKVYLGKNLVKGLVKLARKRNETVDMQVINQQARQLEHYVQFRKPQEIFFWHYNDRTVSISVCSDTDHYKLLWYNHCEQRTGRFDPDYPAIHLPAAKGLEEVST